MKRRGNSEGCITKDSRGKWIARLQIGCNSNGNPRIKTFSGNTPTEARRRMNNFKKNLANMICTPKVRHFWRCIFLWQRKDKNIENTRQNSNYLL